LERALEAARQKAKIDKYVVITVPKKKTFLEEWFSKWQTSLSWLVHIDAKPSLPSHVLQRRFLEVRID